MELLFLHALPLNGAMWAAQRNLLPGATFAPTLYGLGAGVEDWAAAALPLVRSGRIVVVGCSVGGSCAIEVAIAAPERVAALVLIGAKAGHRPEPDLHAAALEVVRTQGLEAAWNLYWAPLFSKSASRRIINRAKSCMLQQSPEDIATGITAFHSRKARDAVLPGFSFPVTVITGSEDMAPGLKTSAAQAQAAPKGRLHIIPQCGHYVPLERPQALNAILAEVIAEARPGKKLGGKPQ